MCGVNIVNLTSHPIRVMSKVFESEGNARVMIKEKLLYHNNESGIIFQANVYGDVIGLPEPKDNTIYIVSKYVFNVLHHRKDLAFPGRHLDDGEGDAVSENLIVQTDFIISKFSGVGDNNTGTCGNCPNKNIRDDFKLDTVNDEIPEMPKLKKVDRDPDKGVLQNDTNVSSLANLTHMVYSDKTNNFNSVGDAFVKMMNKKKLKKRG